jgi:hypothetical protein
MRIHQRATKLYHQLFKHPPDFADPDQMNKYLLLERALRDVAYDCKTLAEQQVEGIPQGVWGEGMRQGATRIAVGIDRDVAK